MDLSQYISRKKEISYTSVPDEMVLINIKDSSIYNLNEVGSLIWQLADGKHSLGEIAVRVAEEYDVSLSDARKDISELVKQLLEEDLILLSSESQA